MTLLIFNYFSEICFLIFFGHVLDRIIMPCFGIIGNIIFSMDKISFYRDRNYLVASIQGYVSQKVIDGLRDRGFRYDKEIRVYRAPFSERAESYLNYLDKVCKDKLANKAVVSSKPVKKTYLDYFNEGLSAEEIAMAKNVKVRTVYENLLKYAEEGSLDHRSLMDKKRFDMIREYLQDKDLSFLTPLVDNAPFAVEYWEVKLVRSYMSVSLD